MMNAPPPADQFDETQEASSDDGDPQNPVLLDGFGGHFGSPCWA